LHPSTKKEDFSTEPSSLSTSFSYETRMKDYLILIKTSSLVKCKQFKSTVNFY
jgi:hypothetical protein